MNYRQRQDNYQPNIITRSRQEFSYLERKMLLHCINQIDFDLTKPDVNLRFNIPVSILKSNYKEINLACDSITSKKIYSTEKESGFTYLVPFPKVKYYTGEDGKAYIELTMLSDVVQYFLELKNSYTSYNLEIMLSIKSVYAQRIFEIIMMFTKGRKRYVFDYNIDELQNILSCNYPNFADFKKRVLEPSIAELREKANIIFEYHVIGKKGKKVTDLQFVVKTPERIAQEAVESELYQWSLLTEEELRRTCEQLLDSYQFSTKQVKAILSDGMLIRKFMLLDSQLVNGEIKGVRNATAYLAQSLGFGKEK